MSSEKLQCAPENAQKMWDWIQNRGGIATWKSINLSNLGASWSSPALTDGVPTKKPTWEAEETPSRITQDPAQVIVTVPKEVKRFRVAVRVGIGIPWNPCSGLTFRKGLVGCLSLKVTDASTRKIRKTMERLNSKAWYEFDYSTQEAVFFVPDKEIPLDRYIASITEAQSLRETEERRGSPQETT